MVFFLTDKALEEKISDIIFHKPIDNGYYLFTLEEKRPFLKVKPKAEKWFRKFIGSAEFINNIERYCLWLKEIQPYELKQLPKVYERVQLEKSYRLKNSKTATVKKAETPALFDEIRQPNNEYLVIPEVSSERRKYLPIGYMPAKVIGSNKNYMLPNASLYHFGILNLLMHKVWIHHVSGRLKSDIQYSNGIVYNNFTWPENPSKKQVKAVEAAAQNILDVWKLFPDSSLADLYDPNTMPATLIKSHQALDKTVDLCYR